MFYGQYLANGLELFKAFASKRLGSAILLPEPEA